MSDKESMIIGFTGTRKGMTEQQKSQVRDLLSVFVVSEAHHGGCKGADSDFHWAVRDVCGEELPVTIYPSNFGASAKMDLSSAELEENTSLKGEKDPWERNKDIIDPCDVIFATPAQPFEEPRGGTWHAVRYSRKTGKKIIVIWPDGSVRHEG